MTYVLQNGVPLLMDCLDCVSVTTIVIHAFVSIDIQLNVLSFKNCFEFTRVVHLDSDIRTTNQFTINK